MTSKLDAYRNGWARGHSVASWHDMPELGTRLSPDIDWQGIGTIASVTDQIDAWEAMCREAESNGRQYSPFELTAHEFNSQGDRAEDLWQAFDAGIEAGIRAYRRKHYKLKDMRKAAREAD